MKLVNLSIISIIIAFIIAIVQLVIYQKDADGTCRSRKLNLGFGITSIILCTIWLIFMIVALVMARNPLSPFADRAGFSIM